MKVKCQITKSINGGWNVELRTTYRGYLCFQLTHHKGEVRPTKKEIAKLKAGYLSELKRQHERSNL